MIALLLAAFAFAADTDGDSVPDPDDRCSFEDDTVDLDANGVADCHESILWEFGFADTATLHAYKDPGTSSLVWDPDDMSGYTRSGSGMISNGYGTGQIQVVQCVPVNANFPYVAMGRMTTSSDNSHHWLLIKEFVDVNCAQAAWSTYLSYWGWGVEVDRVAPDPDAVLVGTYQPPSHVRAIQLWAIAETSDPEYPIIRSWFDDLSIHPIGDVPKGPPAGDPTE